MGCSDRERGRLPNEGRRQRDLVEGLPAPEVVDRVASGRVRPVDQRRPIGGFEDVAGVEVPVTDPIAVQANLRYLRPGIERPIYVASQGGADAALSIGAEFDGSWSLDEHGFENVKFIVNIYLKDGITL